MPVAGNPDNLFIGRSGYRWSTCDIHEILANAREHHFDFVCLPLGISNRDGEYAFEPSVDSDLVCDSKTWSSAVCGEVSPWIDPDGELSERSLVALWRELQWSSHLGVYSTMLPRPNPRCCSRYAQAVNRFIAGGGALTHLVVTVPLVYPDGTNGWQAWNQMRLLCAQNPQLAVALELTEDLPDHLERWFAEPLKHVVIPTSIFLSNKSGFPVLSKSHQKFVQKLFYYKVQVVVRPEESIDDGETKNQNGCVDATSSPRPYVNYIARLFQNMPGPSEKENYETSYRDYLQAPLQPLQDNLESQTYETFEKDPVKYVQYGEAVFQCIDNKVKLKGDHHITIMVVGAGRGPLVQASINAAARANVTDFEVWAVEKNPNAVVTLRHRKRMDEGWNKVTIVHQDMRKWDAPTKADIMVSELLGSFGDNELSPECLDGAQRFLAPDGVSIPEHYYSTLRLVSSTKLWHDVKNYGDLEHFETAYVVKFHQFCCPSSVQKVFSFSHPNWDAAKSNERYKELTFVATADALIHGFAGFFHADLYKDIHISIEPETESTDMFSWFPIYFPVHRPVEVKEGQEVRAAFWRLEDEHKVWYEWALLSPPGSIHNPGGRSYYIGK